MERRVPKRSEIFAPNILVVTISVNFNWIVALVACIVWVALSCIDRFVVIWSNCCGLVAWAEWKSQKVAAAGCKNRTKTLISISKIFQHNFIQKLILWNCMKLLKFKPKMNILIQRTLRYNQTHKFYFSDRKRRLSGLELNSLGLMLWTWDHFVETLCTHFCNTSDSIQLQDDREKNSFRKCKILNKRAKPDPANL